MLSFLTISFCYQGCTFLFINKIMCINQKSHQYLCFLFILKNKPSLYILRLMQETRRVTFLAIINVLFFLNSFSYYVLHDPWVCTIITMWFRSSVRPSVLPWSISEKYAKRWQCVAEHHFGQLCSFSENAHWVTLEPHGIFWSNFAYIYIM